MRDRRLTVSIVSLLVLILYTAVGYTSCIKDKCTATVCENGAVCVEGLCACAPGYYGDHCETAWNSRFLGTWQVADTVVKLPGSLNNYTIDISNTDSNSTPYSFVIDNLASLADSVGVGRLSHIDFKINDKMIDSTLTISGGAGKLDTLTNTFTAYYTFKYKDTAINHFIRCKR